MPHSQHAARALLAMCLYAAAPRVCEAIPGRAAPPSGMRLDNEVCDEIKKVLPLSCQIDDTCLKIGCDVNVLGYPLEVKIDLDPCSGGSLAQIEVEFPPLKVSFNHSIARCEDDIIPIPGLNWTIDGVRVEAQAATHIGGDVRNLNVSIGIDGCADVSIGTICGRDVTKDLPFVIFSTPGIDLTSACGSTPVPPPENCKANALDKCGACAADGLKVWCWKDEHCYEVGDPFDPCTTAECTSTSSHSTCACQACSNSTCSTPQDYLAECESCVSVNHGIFGSNWCWNDLKCHDVASVFDPCKSTECVKNTASTHANCACTKCGDATCKR